MSYDDWKQDAPEDDDERPAPCCVCRDDGDEPCSEACAYVAELQQLRRDVVGYYEASRTALRLARVYREEDGPGRRREAECVRQVRAYRDEISIARFGRRRAA